MSPKIAYIALGSNLNDPKRQIHSAMQHISIINDCKLIKTAPLYQNPPMGPQNQPDFINTVVAVRTTLTAHALLEQLQQIEQRMGRIRHEHWGSRVIDLDLLLYENETYQDAVLTLPHPGVYTRLFFIQPLHFLAPYLHLPDGRELTLLLNQVSQTAAPLVQLERTV